jgi:hypothetical protein
MKPYPIKRRFTLPYPWEIRAVLTMLFRQGVSYRSRWRFWKYFFLAMLKFERKQFEMFLTTFVMGEHYFIFRESVREKLLAALARNRSEMESFLKK